MRRWWLWSIAIGSAVAVLAIATLLLKPLPPPFAFLEDERPVQVLLSPQERRIIEKRQLTQLVYSFMGDFESVTRRAGLELARDGFQSLEPKLKPNPEPVYYKRAPGKLQVVSLSKDARILDGADLTVDDHSSAYKHQPGWITAWSC
jgi:hypothetical protein